MSNLNGLICVLNAISILQFLSLSFVTLIHFNYKAVSTVPVLVLQGLAILLTMVLSKSVERIFHSENSIPRPDSNNKETPFIVVTLPANQFGLAQNAE